MAISEKDKTPDSTEKLKLPAKGVMKKKVFFSRLKRKIFKHVWVLRGLIILSGLVLFVGIVFLTGLFLKQTKVPSYFELAYNFIFTPRGKLAEIDGRTNILFLGKGGEGHEAPDLTDTMLLVSLDKREKKITLISLPRDIWIASLRTKLNSVYYWGNKKEPEGGLVLAKATVEEILGKPIHYAAILDFSGFKRIIDVLGGIEVEVENSFVDTKYPIPGRENDLCGGDPEYKCRYETLRFTQGRQTMDGETALKFVRSRNSEGDEGTDFARQKRQQSILKGIEEKVLNRKILFSPKKMLELKSAVLSSIETDVEQSEAAVIARGMFSSRKNIVSAILPENLLVNPPKSAKYDNLYVFVPIDGEWLGIHKWVSCVLENGQCP